MNTPRIPGAPSTRAWTHPKALLGTIRRFAVDPNSVLERQLGIAGVYVLSQVLFLLPGVTVLHAAPVAAGGVVIAGPPRPRCHGGPGRCRRGRRC